MGLKKQVKTEAAPRDEGAAWGTKRAKLRSLGPAAAGLGSNGSRMDTPSGGGPPVEVDTSAPSVDYQGFSKIDLNDRYYESDQMIHGRPTYWGSEHEYFIYWQ